MRRAWVWLAVICLSASQGAAEVTNLVVATWNVENLFDSADDPENEGDDEYTPRGGMYWSYPRYMQKLTNLAEVVAAMRPDILCLQEVENRRVLDDLARVTSAAFDWKLPVIVHREGGDKRWIDVAILSRHEPSRITWSSPVPGMRDQLAATFVIDGRELTVFCNHWKSWSGEEEVNTAIRTKEAHHLAERVRQHLAEYPGAAALAAGDFNDQVESDILIKEAGFVPWPPDPEHPAEALLHNLSGLLPPKGRGTYYYSRHAVWNSFDSISVSPSMLPDAAQPAAWQVATNTYALFVSNVQTNASGWPLSYWRALRTQKGRLKVGTSDHFPVRVELRSGGTGEVGRGEEGEVILKMTEDREAVRH